MVLYNLREEMKLCRQGCGHKVDRPDKRADCDDCFNRLRREQYRDDKEYREHILKKNTDFFRTPKGKSLRMLRDARGRAVKAGLPFNITIEDIIIPRFCPYLGIRIELSNEGKQDSSPSLDKIVPPLGHVTGNVEVISERANTLKSNGTWHELQQIAVRLRRILTGGEV